MADALLVSNLVLWCVVIVLALLVFALARQVGVLHERVAPAGALQPTSGPKIGELTQQTTLPSLTGGEVSIGGTAAAGEATLVLWVSPTCPVCKALVPTARALARDERLRLVFASDGDKLDQHRAYVRDLKIDKYPYVVSQAFGMSYGVSKLPFAILIGPDGTLKSKGLVNTREHLESLVESMETGIGTLQDYVRLVEDDAAKQVKEQTL
ncbi:MAG: thiol-disulfide isomerase [Gammaproteobacteria bacterium]|nr:thiol-disulfide isomerase [Gammaproteobacteria bacterium]MDH4253615.1 thiol-disulfide isomerase [Gammaproteobacteria bacterium]MDH5310378.1 thiol-disulfide isomerase [Gammaproteobacteria bacterium]